MSSIKKSGFGIFWGARHICYIKMDKKNTYNCEVITFTADLGQGEELTGIEEKAKNTGATKAYVLDLKEEFARDYVFPAFRLGPYMKEDTFWGPLWQGPLLQKKWWKLQNRKGQML